MRSQSKALSYIIITVIVFVQQVDVEETWMNGLRKEPLNVSVDLDEERSALAWEGSSRLKWNTIFNIQAELIRHRETGSLWPINSAEATRRHVQRRGVRSHSHIRIYPDLHWPQRFRLQSAARSRSPEQPNLSGACERDNRGGGERAYLWAACRPSVAVTSDGWKATSDDITWRGSLFLRNQTHPWRWQGKLTVMDARVEEGASVSVYTSRTRHLIPSSSSSLHLCIGSCLVMYSRLSWPAVMVFRLFKVACACARPENGKQTQVNHLLFLLNPNSGWLFGLSQNSAACSHYQSHPLFYPCFLPYSNDTKSVLILAARHGPRRERC